MIDYLLPLRQPLLILWVALGTFAGVYVGAIPGLSGTMAMSLLVSFTFSWETEPAVALMIGIFVGVVFGGSRSAILMNIPGAPAAVATGFDGYPLAQQAKAGKTMGLATVQSVLGTLLGTLVLMLAAPWISELATSFRSVDYLLLALMGMLTVGSLSTKSLRKGILAAALGILAGTVGMDPLTAVRRFTFGNSYLNAGVDFVVALIGLFGASEALVQLADLRTKPVRQKSGRILPSLKETVRYLPLSLRSAVIGVLVGALPGAGGDIAALLAYDQAKRTVRHPSAPFGEGAVEGVIAPETANNAAIGGALIPMLTLGIPGDAVTAVLIGALTVHGLQPGPNLMRTDPGIFQLIVSCLLLGAVFILVFGLTGIRLFTKLADLPKTVLMPLILVLSVIGAYAIRSNLYDVLWMFGFALLGYLMKRYGYPVGPAVLGIILCKLLETNFIRGVRLNGGSLSGLFFSVFQSPISVVLFLLTVVLGVSRSSAWQSLCRRWRG